MKLLGALLLACGLALSAGAAPLPATGTVEVLFSPWDDAEGALLRTLQAARSTIHVQAYTLSSRNIASALVAAHRRGVRVEILADRDQSERNEHSLLPTLHEAGIPLFFEVRYAAAHNKIMLIDAEGAEPVVITGSYNFTFSAQARNAENLLILRGDAALARIYLDNWRRHRQDAVAYTR
jgi:phosphatidylserine/phosphatidylglycerophosphate/cardiolipin synthase-like enzyme